MNTKYGQVGIATVSPKVSIGNPAANREIAENVLKDKRLQAADIVVFPELSLTGYTCGDLFKQNLLLEETEKQITILKKISTDYTNNNKLIFVGAPIRVNGALLNCAVVICNGAILGIVPKQFIPNYNEFYERRHFAAACGNEPTSIVYAGSNVPFGINLLFEATPELVVGVEICEDLFVPIPPSSYQALAGASVIVNLSASNELIGKMEYRKQLVENQSARCLAAYAYASAGPTESSTDIVFGGHCMIAENGHIIAESKHIGDGTFVKEGWEGTITLGVVDVQKLAFERQTQTSFGDQRNLKNFKRIHWNEDVGLAMCVHPKVNGFPFVPSNPETLKQRCEAIFDIQCAALVQRIKSVGLKKLVIGVSGGLDSTLALLVACKAVKIVGLPMTAIHAYTLPGFGTTAKTKKIALDLMAELGVTAKTIDIKELCMAMFRANGNKPFGIDLNGLTIDQFMAKLQEVPKDARHDLDFENTQARMRTDILMKNGFVLGTGDMSELALGWCTYNADHASMYNVNCSIPKTLVRFLVKYVAENQYSGKIKDILLECVGLTISPELLPTDKNGNIEQSTEDILGPYALHDFFLWSIVRCGNSPEKTLFLARNAEFFDPVNNVKYVFDEKTIKETLHKFLSRFFTSQFKRDCVPGGPKVGSVSLSPRGDWRMPSDVNPEMWKI